MNQVIPNLLCLFVFKIWKKKNVFLTYILGSAIDVEYQLVPNILK